MKETWTVTAHGKEVRFQVWDTPEGYATNLAMKLSPIVGLPAGVIAHRFIRRFNQISPDIKAR